MTGHRDHTAGLGPVLLDIGGDYGALIVHMPARMASEEVEICPAGQDRVAAPRQHVGVHMRRDQDLTAVFPSLLGGVYDLYRKPDGPTEVVATVQGGLVTELDWPP